MKLHKNNKGELRRCREKAGKCPYGSPVAQTATRARGDVSSVLKADGPDESLPFGSSGRGYFKNSVGDKGFVNKKSVSKGLKKEIKSPETLRREEVVARHRVAWDSYSPEERIAWADEVISARYSELGLGGVPVIWNNDTHKFASCLGGDGKAEYFTFSMRMNANQSFDNFYDTVNHEAAHALSPLNEQHGDIWKSKCLELGGNGKECGHNEHKEYSHKLMGECPSCGKKFYAKDKRSGKAILCGECWRTRHKGMDDCTVTFKDNPDYMGNFNFEKIMSKVRPDNTVSVEKSREANITKKQKDSESRQSYVDLMSKIKAENRDAIMKNARENFERYLSGQKLEFAMKRFTREFDEYMPASFKHDTNVVQLLNRSLDKRTIAIIRDYY